MEDSMRNKLLLIAFAMSYVGSTLLACGDDTQSTPDKSTASPDKSTAFLDKGTASSDKNTASSDKSVGASDKGTITSDKGQVAPDTKPVFPDSKDPWNCTLIGLCQTQCGLDITCLNTCKINGCESAKTAIDALTSCAVLKCLHDCSQGFNATCEVCTKKDCATEWSACEASTC
jgi:hypothetical protein